MKKIEKTAADYLKKIGYEKIINYEDPFNLLEKRLGEKITEETLNRIDVRGRNQENDDLDFYTFKNEDLNRSIAISCAFEYDFDMSLCIWILEHKKLFHGKILEIGCDCGVFSSFLGLNFPNLKIVSIDVCEKAVNNAKELAEKMGVTNVEFKCLPLQKLDETFDTIFSSKVAHENFKQIGCISFYRPLSDPASICRNRLDDFAAQLRKHLVENGTLISIERMGFNPVLLGWMYALNSHNFNITETFYGTIDFIEYAIQGNRLPVLISQSDASVPRENLDKFYLRYFEEDFASFEPFNNLFESDYGEVKGKTMTFAWRASARLNAWKKDLIEGYYGCHKGKVWYKYAIWSNNDNPNTLLVEDFSHQEGYKLKIYKRSCRKKLQEHIRCAVKTYSSPQDLFYRFHYRDGKEVREKEPVGKSDL